MDLDGFRRHPLGHLRREQLRHRGLAGAFEALIAHLRRVQIELTCRLDLSGHLGQRERDRLVLDDGAPEGLALLGIGMCGLERSPCAAGGLGRGADAAQRQVAQRNAEAAPDLAEDIAGRHAHVLKDHLARVVGSVAELVLLGDHAVAGVVGGRDERGHAPLAGARIGHRHDHRHIGGRSCGDERLVAVEDVLVAVPGGPGTDGRRVRSGVGLGEVDAAQPLAAGELGEVAALLLVGARLLDRHGDRRVVRRHHVADAAIGCGDLLDGQRV